MAIKPVVFFAGEIRTPPFSPEARKETGDLLWSLQNGESLSMPQSRSMPSIGTACHELRVRDANDNWRIIYYVDDVAIVVLYVFSKKTEKTPTGTIDLCKKRLREYQKEIGKP